MLKYAKVIIEETKECIVGLGDNITFYESIGMTEQDVEQSWDGRWFLTGYAPEEPEKTMEEVEAMRRSAYIVEVDPITSHIQRLRDEEQTEEIIAKIEDLKSERNVKVDEIKERFPYQDSEQVD